jgi:hypothetical protein
MTMDGEDEDFDGGGYEGGDTGSPQPAEDTTSRSEVEEAVIRQKQDRGDPDPYRADGRIQLKGRNDTAHGGRYEGLEQYAAEARKNGTSIQNAVKDYVEVENAWRHNPVHGVIYTAQRLGLDPRQLVAAAYGTLFGQAGDQNAQRAAQAHQINSAHRDIAAFERDPANKYFPQVRMDMARLVQAGRAKTLPQAYRMAINQHPQLRVLAKMERLDAARDRDMKRARRFSSYGGY